jgi:thiol-disulfide isomerase/thioredoxin
VVQNTDKPLTALRAEQASAKGLPQPSDPTRFTSVKDPTEPFRFSFPDLDGKIVSNTDPRFASKVMIVAIGGSWCPNCHDETPFLVELYKKYKKQGLEIVELSFEEEAQIKNPVRVRAFNKRYGVDYTVLIPGEPKELNDKVPQGVNLNSFPTTFFLGRDGRVRSAHAGFAGKASGKFHTELKEEVTALVERLLAEKPAQTSAAK